MRGQAITMRSDADYQAESDLNTLIEAEKIKKDSKRLTLVMARKKMLMEALAIMDYTTSHNTKSSKPRPYQ